MFLKGEKERLVATLKRRMEQASRALHFEEAASVRDLIFALEKIAQPQSVVTADFTPIDIVGFSKEGEMAAMVILGSRWYTKPRRTSPVLAAKVNFVDESCASFARPSALSASR